MTSRHRSPHLDGLRGIAAVAVALLHFLRSFDNTQLGPVNSLNYSPFSAFWNGHFAVSIFFTMSGFLFFRKFFGAEGTACVRAAVKRYFRLSVPILALSLIAFLLHLGGYMQNAEAAAISGSDWLVKWYRFSPDIGLAIGEPMYSGYVHFDAARSYNTNLWTISYELFAVFAVIALAWLCGRVKLAAQIALAIAAVVLSFGTHYCEFFLGALLALGLQLRTSDITLPAALSVVIIALTAARLHQGPVPHAVVVNIIYPIASMAVIFAVEKSAAMRSWLSTKWLMWLGRISFGVYLVHFIVLSSGASAVWLASSSVTLTFAAYAIMTMLGAILFFAAIDRPWLALLDLVFDGRRRLRQTNPAAKPVQQ